MTKDFQNITFFDDLKSQKIWTVSNNKKMPLDFVALINEQQIKGASFKNPEKWPLVDLETIFKTLPNVTNVALLLNNAINDIMILDIEPTCSEERKKELMALPCDYMETSMSGKGVHMIFKNVPTNFPDIKLAKNALKANDNTYEFLLNKHYVTLTGNVIQNTPSRPVEDIQKEFDLLAETAKINQHRDIQLRNEYEQMEIPFKDEIIAMFDNIWYNKTPENFGNDMSTYEYAALNFYFSGLKAICNIYRYNNNVKYTDEEKILLLYNIANIKLENRSKHNEFRNGLPYLLFISKAVVSVIND